MKKKLIVVLLASSLLFSMNACSSEGNSSSGGSQATSESAEPLDLTGVWASEAVDGSYQEAVISGSTISIDWVSDNGATTAVYWIGTYVAPTSDTDEYSWTSERDKEKTDSALLASTDDTKDFSYKDGKISYSASSMGITTTYELTQTSSEVPEDVSESDTPEATPTEVTSSASGIVEATPVPTQTAESAYEVTYEDITFYTDEFGYIYGKSIVEVTNTGDTDLYLDYSSYELISDSTGAIIHTTSDMFMPYPNVIGPGEKGYYYEYVPMDAGTPTEGISITSHIKVAPAAIEKIRYDVSDTAIYDKEYGGFDVHGMVTNSSGEKGEYVNVVAILFDSEQHPFGVVWNNLSSVESNDSVGFELESYTVPDNITTSMISSYTVLAYPDQYQYTY